VLITSHDRRFLDTVAQRYVLIQGKRLVEVSDPSEFYESPDDAAAPRSAPRGGVEPRRPQADDALARIVEVEALLDADLARKPRFQKPELQQQWRAELDQLYRRLERD
jgi:ATP-binding cassette subfamily F protein 3